MILKGAFSMPRCSLMSMGTPLFFISKLKFSYDKYSVDKVWTKIYCHFYFRGITLRVRLYVSLNFWKIRVQHYCGNCCWRARPCSPAAFSMQIQTGIKSHSLMPGALKLAILMFSTCFLRFCHSSSCSPYNFYER